MPESLLRLVRRSKEFAPKEEIPKAPKRLRGIYVLYKRKQPNRRRGEKFDVLYVGMATAGRRRGMQGRLRSHAKSRRKGDLWTHFSVYEVWDNIRDEEVAELEGLFRHIYRKDSVANSLNIQRGFKKARGVRVSSWSDWT